MTEIKYYVSWKSDTQRTRKEAYFDTLWGAETWYNEKLTEGKKPKLWMKSNRSLMRRLMN